jgi:hypothetical protein
MEGGYKDWWKPKSILLLASPLVEHIQQLITFFFLIIWWNIMTLQFWGKYFV